MEEEKKVENGGNDESSDIVLMGDKDEESEIEMIEVKKVENGEDELKKKIKELWCYYRSYCYWRWIWIWNIENQSHFFSFSVLSIYLAIYSLR